MMKLRSLHIRFPWDIELERTIGVGQTLFNLVNSSFFFIRCYANVDEIRRRSYIVKPLKFELLKRLKIQQAFIAFAYSNKIKNLNCVERSIIAGSSSITLSISQ